MWLMNALQERAAACARAGAVDETAPVIASAQITVEAPAQTVWEVLSQVEQWPQFLPGVTRARWTDQAYAAVPGARFSWANAGIPVHSRIEVAEPGAELTWTGVALWLVAVHRNTLNPLSGDRCRLTSTESMAGPGAGLLMPAARLDAQLAEFVGAVASEASSRVA